MPWCTLILWGKTRRSARLICRYRVVHVHELAKWQQPDAVKVLLYIASKGTYLPVFLRSVCLHNLEGIAQPGYTRVQIWFHIKWEFHLCHWCEYETTTNVRFSPYTKGSSDNLGRRSCARCTEGDELGLVVWSGGRSDSPTPLLLLSFIIVIFTEIYNTLDDIELLSLELC